MQEQQSRTLKYTKSFEDLKKTLKSPLFGKLAEKFPILNYRTPFDRSDYSAIENIVRGFFKSFTIAYGLKAGLNLISTLLKFSKWMKDPTLLLKALVSKDNFQLGWFLATLSAVMKATITVCRIIRKKDDGYNGFFGGLLAGWLSLFFLAEKGRGFLACFMLSRAFDCYYNHLVAQGTIKKAEWHYVLIFAILNMLTGYGFAHEKYLISPALDNFYDKVTVRHPNDYTIMNLWLEITRRRLVRSGVIKEPYLIGN